MKHIKVTKILLSLFAVVFCFGPVGLAEPVGTAFTYQGRLLDANQTADGLYDFQFKLFNDATDGSQFGTDVNAPEVDVIDGYFTVELDFNDANAFNGSARWLQIGVRPGVQNDPCAYSLLSPRQKITPTPYALYALNGGGGGGGGDSDWIITGNNMYSGVSGNVGIGTASPAAKLSVNGGISASSINTNSISAGPISASSITATGSITAGDISTTSAYKIGGNTVLSAPGDNTFVGLMAGAVNTGSYNTFSGFLAGYYNNSGYNNTFLGYRAGYYNTTGNSNTFSGCSAGFSNTEGAYNTFSGYGAGCFNTIGNSNTFLGYCAGYSNGDGTYNTFSGYRAGYSNINGLGNTFSGYQTGYFNTGGCGNTFSGEEAGYNTTGNYNTFSGYQAGYNNTTGSGNVFLGYRAGYSETSSNKLYIANSSTNPPLIYGDFSAKNVGINTTTPARNLHINDVMRLQPRATAPSSPAEGDIYYSSASHTLMVYNGTTWMPCF